MVRNSAYRNALHFVTEISTDVYQPAVTEKAAKGIINLLGSEREFSI
jgi:hypothetical protein